MNEYIVQKDPFIFRPCKKNEITLRQLINTCHYSTEILSIYIVQDYICTKDMPKGCKKIPQYLSQNVFMTNLGSFGSLKNDEVERILKYYGDCPCWNLVARFESYHTGILPVLETHVYFRDIKASFIQEHKERRKK